MSGTIGYDDLRAATVRQVAQLMAAAAITAPKSGGRLFLAGKPNFKAVGFDRPMPEADFDTLDLPPTGTQPAGIPGAARQQGARNRQAPRQPIRRTQP
jgi:hypothetical protein